MALHVTLGSAMPGQGPQQAGLPIMFAAGAVRGAGSATSILYANPDGTNVVVGGADMAFDELGVPTGGTISSVGLFDATLGTLHVTVEGLALDLAAFDAAWLGPEGGDAAVQAMLLAGDDVVLGSDGPDRLMGSDGFDIIDGGAADYVPAAASDAEIDAGPAQAGFDTVDYSGDAAAGGTGGVIVDLEGGVAVDGFGDVDILVSIEAAAGTDSTADAFDGYAEMLFGSAGDNVIDANGGSDLVHAGDGADVVRGGDDADGLFGEDGADWIEAGAGDDVVFGGEGDDGIVGALGDDVLFGGGGDDFILGGAGRDVMLGEAGADGFAIDAADLIGGEADIIMDFVPGVDRIVSGVLDGMRDAIAFADGALAVDTGDGQYYVLAVPGVTETQLRDAIVGF